MAGFYYLNYFIYRFYERRDPDPFIYSLNASPLLLVLNFMTFFYGINYFVLDMQMSLNYYTIVVVLLILVGVNYFFLYRKNKYEDIFLDIKAKDNNIKQVLCLSYIILTCLSSLAVILLIKFLKYDAI